MSLSIDSRDQYKFSSQVLLPFTVSFGCIMITQKNINSSRQNTIWEVPKIPHEHKSESSTHKTVYSISFCFTTQTISNVRTMLFFPSLCIDRFNSSTVIMLSTRVFFRVRKQFNEQQNIIITMECSLFLLVQRRRRRS